MKSKVAWSDPLVLAAIGSVVAIAGFPLWFATPWLEVAGFVTGLFGVALAAKGSIWNFPVGIVNVGIYTYIFFDGKLFADSGLQVVYLLLLIHGWLIWKANASGGAFSVGKVPGRTLVWSLIATSALAGGLIPLLRANHGSFVVADSITTAISLMGQFFLNRKYIENWIVWILVDAVYVPLYVAKGWTATAILYGIFGILAIQGYVEWRKKLALT